MKLNNKLGLVGLCLTLSACNTLDRLEEVGKAPVMEKEKNPVQQANYQPITNWPTNVEPEVPAKKANSLWQPGSRSFFKDQRASRIGDILTVVVSIADKATLDNSTTRARTNSEKMGAPQIFGMQHKIVGELPGVQDPASLLSLSGDNKSTGNGQIGRKEDITTKIAAIVTQILPNGNMAIKGTQQVRVNYEMREVAIEGVIRPEDIASDNTIKSEQIAEARISYGGKGIISDVQQPRYGNQIIDVLSPF